MEKFTQIKNLYQKTFGDSTEYIDFIFNEIYTQNRIKYEEKDGKIVSFLGILPRAFCYAKKSVQGAFISGVATDENERGKGAMKGLMKKVLTEYSTKQCGVVFLSPKNERYYISQGFRLM